MNIELLVPIIIGLTEIIKRTGTVDTKFVPLVAVLVGVILNYMIGETNFVFGIIAGLSAAGLWDAGKSSLKVAGVLK